MDAERKGIVPRQETGGQSNTEASRTFKNRPAALEFYRKACERLLRVNSWHGLAGEASAAFQLTDASGTEVDRPVAKGDHFKIDIPGPGTVTGAGYDWVQVEDIREGEEDDCIYTVVHVRPATNPNNERPDTAHFFSEDASSSFMVRCEGETVTAAVYGRNEKPNAEAQSLIDKTRNLAIAGGAIAGGSKIQWKSLVEGIIKEI